MRIRDKTNNIIKIYNFSFKSLNTNKKILNRIIWRNWMKKMKKFTRLKKSFILFFNNKIKNKTNKKFPRISSIESVIIWEFNTPEPIRNQRIINIVII